MVFKDASKVQAAIVACDNAEWVRGKNRAKVNNMFNGAPLLTENDAQKMGLRINCNLGEAPVIAQHGRRQYGQAFLSPNRYFKVTIPDAPPEKVTDWSTFITRKINRILKKSRAYLELHRSQWASVLLHGIAPKIWQDKYSWLPCYVALEDFRVPTDTKCSFEQLSWFAVRRNYTEGELSRKVFGPGADKAWNKKPIQKILDTYHDKVNAQTGDITWMESPEKMAELIKQNAGYYSSDAVPTIPLWHFYYLDDDNLSKKEWKLCVVPDQKVQASSEEFLYEPTVVCDHLDKLVHMQYGDLNNKSPFLYHSVRALGFLLMEPIFHDNLLKCRVFQHIHEHMNIWLRSTDPAGKARAQKMEMYDRAFIPEGISIVPQTERHQSNPNLIEMGLNICDTLKQQASVSYTQDSEGVRSGEETATGVMARVNAVNALVSGLLQTAFNYEIFAYQEISRRFCLKGSDDPDVKEFQRACKEHKIPVTYLNSDMWEIEVEQPIGSGNPTMAMAMASKLLEMRPMFDGTAQQEILHEATTVFTGDPRKAERWVPLEKSRGVTDAQEHSELAFSTLMLGVPVRPREGLSLNEQIETMLGLTAGVIARIEQTGNMATAAEVAGLRNVEQYTGKLIEQLGQNPAERAHVKEYSNMLGKLMNSVKAFEQRLAEAQAGQQKESISINYKDAPPEIQRQMEMAAGFKPAASPDAQVDAKTQKALHSMALKDAQHQQKQKQSEEQFDYEQRRKDAEVLLSNQRADVETMHSIAHEKVKEENKPKKPAANGA